jgi:hypothetical protein
MTSAVMHVTFEPLLSCPPYLYAQIVDSLCEHSRGPMASKQQCIQKQFLDALPANREWGSNIEGAQALVRL